MAETGWRDLALCAQSDPEAWFPEKGESVRMPKAICRRCPSRVPCLRMAMALNIEFGVWGGLSHTQREDATPAYRQGVSLEVIIAAADADTDARREALAQSLRARASAASVVAAALAREEKAAWLASESASNPEAA